jgi:hypothetical protein
MKGGCTVCTSTVGVYIIQLVDSLHCPVNCGLRFSTKAISPSVTSAVPPTTIILVLERQLLLQRVGTSHSRQCCGRMAERAHSCHVRLPHQVGGAPRGPSRSPPAGSQFMQACGPVQAPRPSSPSSNYSCTTDVRTAVVHVITYSQRQKILYISHQNFYPAHPQPRL